MTNEPVVTDEVEDFDGTIRQYNRHADSLVATVTPEDLTAGTTEVRICLLRCGHVTWLQLPMFGGINHCTTCNRPTVVIAYIDEQAVDAPYPMLGPERNPWDEPGGYLSEWLADNAADCQAAPSGCNHRKVNTMTNITAASKPGTKLTLSGVSIGHGCDDCFKLIVKPEYLHGAGARYTGVVTFTAGHSSLDDSEIGSASIDTDDLPELIAKLQEWYGQQQKAGDNFVPGWDVDT